MLVSIRPLGSKPPAIGARFALGLLLCALLLAGCGSSTETQVLPWLRYRHMTSPGGSGIWTGSTTSDVALRRPWGWHVVIASDAAPAMPIPVDETSAVVFTSRGAWMLHPDQPIPALACGDTNADVIVTPKTGFVDCVDFVAGPAQGVRTAVRVRRLSPRGMLSAQWSFAVQEPGRRLLSATISFYDAEHLPYFVSFIDPWIGPDGKRGAATPERLANLRCELLRASASSEPGLAAQPGVTLDECSDAKYWSGVLGRELKPAGAIARGPEAL
jgi:hypothetical protein